jgi:hypothetical protein
VTPSATTEAEVRVRHAAGSRSGTPGR